MRRRAVQAWTLAIVLLAVPAPAYAQDGTPTPSAHELWRDYPLRQREQTQERSGTPSPVRTASRSVAVAEPADSGPALVAVLAAAVLVAAAAGGVLHVRRRRTRSRAFAVPLATAPRLALAGTPADSHRLLFSQASPDRHLRAAPAEPSPQSPGVRPPDPDRAWTAEIQWAPSGDTARFCVLARDERGESEPVIARSEPFAWPPEGAEAVQALVGAADALAEALTVAGWKPLPRGEAWYAKRFGWEPASVAGWAPPRPGTSAEPARAPTNRFRQPGEWPLGTNALWRCAITWRPGYARSRFEVVMHDPTGETDDRVIAASAAFKWLFMGHPDPNDATFREAAVELAALLESAGWERVGVGGPWYAARFVWRGEGRPPDDLLVVSADARSSS